MFGMKYKLKMHSKSAYMMEMSFIPDQLFPMTRCQLRPFLGVFCLRLWSKLVVGKGELSFVAAFRNALKKEVTQQSTLSNSFFETGWERVSIEAEGATAALPPLPPPHKFNFKFLSASISHRRERVSLWAHVIFWGRPSRSRCPRWVRYVT